MPLRVNRGRFTEEEKAILAEARNDRSSFASDMIGVISENARNGIMYQTRASMVNQIVDRNIDNIFNIFTRFDSLGKFIKKEDLIKLAAFREENPMDIVGARKLEKKIVKDCKDYVFVNLSAFTNARRYANEHFDSSITGNARTGYSDATLNDNSDNLEFLRGTVSYLERRLNDWDMNLTEFVRKTQSEGIVVSDELTNFLTNFDERVMNERMLNIGLDLIDEHVEANKQDQES